MLKGSYLEAASEGYEFLPEERRDRRGGGRVEGKAVVMGVQGQGS